MDDEAVVDASKQRKTLSDFSLRQIAGEFASGLLNLTGNVYEVEVLALDRRPKGVLSAELYEIADVTIRVRQSHEDQGSNEIDDTQPTRVLPKAT
jgi:hypothetical protein